MDTVYVLFFPLSILLVLMVYILLQNPKGWGNRIFALYMLTLSINTYSILILSTARNPNTAELGALGILITNYVLNGSFMVGISLSLFHPRLLFRWYGLPLLVGLCAPLTGILFSDVLFGTTLFYIAPPQLGQGYISAREFIGGSVGGVLRGWLFLTMGVSLALMIAAWVQAPRAKRAPIVVLLLSLVAIGGTMPLIPSNPFSTIAAATLFSLAFAVVVGRYRLLVPAQVALEAIFSSSGEGMVVLNQDGHVERVNPAAERLLAVEETRGRPWREVLAPFLQRVHPLEGEMSLDEVITGEEGQPFKKLLQLEQPEQCTIQFTSMSIQDQRGHTQGHLLNFRDVTEGEHIRQLLAIEQEQRGKLEETAANLQQLIAQIRGAAGKLSFAAAEIMSTSTQQAAGATEQAAAITQGSSTIDEVRTIAVQTAQHAQGVAGIAQRTVLLAQTGEQAVADAVSGIEEVRDKVESISHGILALTDRTQAIGEIITAVGEIAAQSNLLALNAAVEAARAGKAGKGFAVVANEMRSLAEQSQLATDRVRDILSEIQNGVNTVVLITEEGTKGAEVAMQLAGEAGQSIQGLAESVESSTQSAVQIAAAAGQQQVGMEQIATAMDNIHQVTVQSVAGARQVERAAGELNALAGQLRQLVEMYR